MDLLLARNPVVSTGIPHLNVFNRIYCAPIQFGKQRAGGLAQSKSFQRALERSELALVTSIGWSLGRNRYWRPLVTSVEPVNVCLGQKQTFRQSPCTVRY